MYILRSNQCGAKTYNSKLRGSPLELTQWWWPGGGHAMADCRTLDSKLVLSLFTDSLVEVFPQTPAPAPPPGYVQDKSTACSFHTLFSNIRHEA